jgi:AraC-like DNA-binding protein
MLVVQEIFMYISRIQELSNHVVTAGRQNELVMPSLRVLNRLAPSKMEVQIYEPVLCLILQGAKTTSIGDQVVQLKAGDALVVSHTLPVVSRITHASKQNPYLAIVLMLDLHIVQSLSDQIAERDLPEHGVRSLSVSLAHPDWLAPLVRYFELSANPIDAKVLGPSTLREIHYRLLVSPAGGMLRKLLVGDSQANRIARSIELLRSEYRLPITVDSLARAAHMSASSFHEHFKSVTGTTPLQYQKDLRLFEAQTLLLAKSHSVSAAAYDVGYESPNQFSRDFSRKFGYPPSQNAKQK